jgi:hypothetical protein
MKQYLGRTISGTRAFDMGPAEKMNTCPETDFASRVAAASIRSTLARNQRTPCSVASSCGR